MIQDILFLFLGLGFLVLGSHWLVRSLKFLSLFFKLKPLFLSIIVLGFVSSSPEWFVTITASMKGSSDAALGNIFGSNVINILLVLALAGIFYKFSMDRQIVGFDLPVLIGSLGLFGLFSINKKIGPGEGVVLLGIFSIYLWCLFRKHKDGPREQVSSPANSSLFQSLTILVLGFVTLFVGSSLAVNSSLSLVKAFSLSERFAGVFILSLSTSLPELATTLQAAFKKEGEMALGNIVGSNLFNTLFVLGSASLLHPLYFSKGLYFDYWFMVLVTLVLWLTLLFFKSVPKMIFGGFIVSYFFYIAFVSGAF